MKIKEGKKFLFILSLIVVLGCVGLIIYQIINKDLDALSFITLVLGMDCLGNSLEKK